MFDFIMGLLAGLCFGFAIFSMLLARSRVVYDGNMVVSRNTDGGLLYSLELDKDPDGFETQKSITFRVVREEDVIQ